MQKILNDTKRQKGFTPLEKSRSERLPPRLSAERSQTGFTLIEILVVIGIIAILAAVVLIAINPARQFAQANDSQRTSNVNAILNAIGQYMADNQGDIPPGGIPLADSSVDANFDDIGDGTGEADLCDALVPTYMPAFPVDPDVPNGPVDDCTVTYNAIYQIIQDDTTLRITVRAVSEVDGDFIEVTR